jgi:cobalt-zinc-cadmium efflux system membrane fusion protein
LVFAVEEAAVAKKQNDNEIARVGPLVEKGLLPEKRRIDLENEGELLATRLRLAQQRLGALTGDGKKGLAVKADIAGVVSEVVVKNGETVEAGAPLVRLGGSKSLWVRARTFARGPFDAAEPATLRAEAQPHVDLAPFGAKFLSPAPTVDPATRVGTWLVDLGPRADTLPSEIRVGAAVVLTARVGASATRVVVPRGAVVDIDTRPFVFVQIDGEHFEKRSVQVGPADVAFTPILGGVDEGERVVTVGGFDIHLAAVMGTVESHRH